MRDRFFSQLPSRRRRIFALDFAREIEKAGVDIFYLNSGGVDLCQGVFDAADGLFALGLAAGEMDNVKQRASVEKDSVRGFLQLVVDLLDRPFAVNGGEQRFKDGKQSLGFVQGKKCARTLLLFYRN